MSSDRLSAEEIARLPEEFREIAERAEKATPGAWKLWTSNSWRRFGSESTGTGVCVPSTYSRADKHPDLDFYNGGENGPDAKFIAHSRTDIPKLLRWVADHQKESK